MYKNKYRYYMSLVFDSVENNKKEKNKYNNKFRYK